MMNPNPLVARSARGYALIIALLVLLIVGSASTMSIRRALGAARQAELHVRSSIEKWGVMSAEEALGSTWNELIESHPSSRARSSSAWFSFELNGVELRARVTDEQAKLNIAQLGHPLSLDAIVSVLNRSLEGGRPNVLGIRSLLDGRASETGAPIGFEVLWNDVTQGQYFGRLGESEDVGCLTDVTLWGDGRLNLRRASDTAAVASLGDLLTRDEIDNLLTRAKEVEAPTYLIEALLDAGFSGRERDELLRRVSLDSHAHAVVIQTLSSVMPDEVHATRMQIEQRRVREQGESEGETETVRSVLIWR